MGVIQKSIRKRGNQKLAAPIYTNTKLSPGEVATAIQQLCEALNKKELADLAAKQQAGLLKRIATMGTLEIDVQYFVKVEQKQILVSYNRPPAHVLAQRQRRVGVLDGYWLAAVTVSANGPDTPAGQNVVRLRLLMWVLNNDGVLKNRAKYLQFADALHAAVSVDGGR